MGRTACTSWSVIDWLQSGDVPTLGPLPKRRAQRSFPNPSPEIDSYRLVLHLVPLLAITSRALLIEHAPQLQPSGIVRKASRRLAQRTPTLWSPSS